MPFLSEVAPCCSGTDTDTAGSSPSTPTAYFSNSWAISSRGRSRHNLSIVRHWRFGITVSALGSLHRSVAGGCYFEVSRKVVWWCV